jgi:flagellar basal body-associated protein FliL
MADKEKEQFPAEAEASSTDAAPKKKKGMLAPIIIVVVLLAEGAGVFVVTKMIYRPEAAKAAEVASEGGEGGGGEHGGGGGGGGHGGGGGEHGAAAAGAADKESEIALPEIRAFNKREGRLFLVNAEVVLRINTEKLEHTKKMLENRKSTISDRLNTVIRSAEVSTLNEPTLETLRRQFRFELDTVLGDEQLILELLIPKFFQTPANL